MFWRFWAADDPEVGIMLSRDCDSRISDREIAAINEWLESDKDFHIYIHCFDFLLHRCLLYAAAVYFRL